jgi:hypothetical protein
MKMWQKLAAVLTLGIGLVAGGAAANAVTLHHKPTTAHATAKHHLIKKKVKKHKKAPKKHLKKKHKVAATHKKTTTHVASAKKPTAKHVAAAAKHAPKHIASSHAKPSTWKLHDNA